MTLFDYAVLIIVGLSVLLGVIRGLAREVLSLTAWVTAFICANLFAAEIAQVLPKAVPREELRLLIAFVAVFLVVLAVISALAVLASRLVKSAGLGMEDRILGSMFGVARGVLIVMILVLLAGLTSLPRQPAWRNALLSDPLEALAGRIKAWLPTDLSRRIKYD